MSLENWNLNRVTESANAMQAEINSLKASLQSAKEGFGIVQAYVEPPFTKYGERYWASEYWHQAERTYEQSKPICAANDAVKQSNITLLRKVESLLTGAGIKRSFRRYKSRSTWKTEEVSLDWYTLLLAAIPSPQYTTEWLEKKWKEVQDIRAGDGEGIWKHRAIAVVASAAGTHKEGMGMTKVNVSARLGELAANLNTDCEKWAWLSYGEKCYAFAVVEAMPYDDNDEEPAEGNLVPHGEKDGVYVDSRGRECMILNHICSHEEQNGNRICKFIAFARTNAAAIAAATEYAECQLRHWHHLMSQFVQDQRIPIELRAEWSNKARHIPDYAAIGPQPAGSDAGGQKR